MDISPSWVGVGISVAGVISGGGVMWAKLESAKKSVNILFDKCDKLNAELADHKLSNAKEYVNIEALKDIMAPIMARLDNIDKHLFRARD